MAGYAGAFGYSAAQAGGAGAGAVLAGWLAGHGLRYGLGGASANVVTVDSGGRAERGAGHGARGAGAAAAVPVVGRAPMIPRRHDATFLVTGAPAARPGDAAEAIPAAAVRATFGPPARVYRFDGFTVAVWDVNLLTKMHG